MRGVYEPMNVPVEVTRKARKGSVSALKDGYLLLAPMTAAVPIAVPMTPPITPPLTEALGRVLAKLPLSFCCLVGWRTRNAPAPALA